MSPAPRDDGFEWSSAKRNGWPRKALLLVNRQGTRGRSRLDDGVRSLHEAGIEATPEMPHEPGRIPARIRAGAAGCDMIVLGGGDGTLSHALDAVLATGLPLGILPMGNANDLARTLNIPTDPQAACRIIAEGNTRPIDVGRIEGADSAPTHFFNVASVGLSVRIARRLTRRRKERYGLLAYLACTWEAIHRQRAFAMRITCDGVTTELTSMQVAIGNGRYYGGGMTIVDDAAIDDGRLDLYALPQMPGWRLAALLPVLRWGWHRPIDNILSLRGEEITLDTDRPLRINVDGEVRGRTPALFRIIPRALRVFAPPPPPPPHAEN